jgi:hypothetical protein
VNATTLRVVMLVLMTVMPGGFVLLAAWLYARAVVAQVRVLEGDDRVVRAVRTVRVRQVLSEARQLTRRG